MKPFSSLLLSLLILSFSLSLPISSHGRSCGTLRCYSKKSIEEARACRTLYEECMKNWFKSEVEKMSKKGLLKKEKARFIKRLEKKMNQQREKNLDAQKLLRVYEIHYNQALALETDD
jgi:hypothetical protein